MDGSGVGYVEVAPIVDVIIGAGIFSRLEAFD